MSENDVPRIVTTISFTVVIILLTLIFSYSYLLIQVVAEKKQLTEELITIRSRLDDEQEKQQLMKENNRQLVTQLANQEEALKILQAQLKEAEEKRCLDCDDTLDDETSAEDLQTCRVMYKEIDPDFFHRAIQKTLSLKTTDRFEGFSILMNNIDYINDHLQREIIEFYLKQMDKKNKDGVYYATSIISQLRPDVLREYEIQLRDWYRPLAQQSGWQRTSYKYCQMENKMNDYFENPN